VPIYVLGVPTLHAQPVPTNNLEIYAHDMPPASHFETHAHDDEALLSYAIEGSCTQLIASRLWAVLPAHAVWMPAGIPHATQMGPRGCRLRTVTFALPIPEDLPAEPCVIEVSPFLAALMAAWEASDANESARRDALRFLLYDEIRRATPLDLSLPRVRDARLSRVTDALQADPADTRSLDEWARLAGMSRRSFIRHFGQETGMNFADWQRRLRLLTARQLLAEGVSVTEAALSLGYQSPSAFIAMVRRELGVTPSQLSGARKPTSV